MACAVEDKTQGRWANPLYPDLQLYQEIIFLQHYFKGKWCVENVIAYYEPLIKPKKIQRHWFWSNYPINEKKFEYDNVARASIGETQNKFGFDLSKYKIPGRKKGQTREDVLEKDQILRNCVDPQLGQYILESAFTVKQEVLT